jgi:hypothetical protein
MNNEKVENLDISSNKLLLSGVSSTLTLSGVLNINATSNVTTKISGWFSDNYKTYYVDESGKKHYN